MTNGGPMGQIRSGSSRRMVTMNTSAIPPSMGPIVEPGMDTPTAVSPAAHRNLPLDMPAGVAMGTMYEYDQDYEDDYNHDYRYNSTAAAAAYPDSHPPLHHQRPANLKSDSSEEDPPEEALPSTDLPQAPYQSMLQEERARTSTTHMAAASRSRLTATQAAPRPYPKPGLPPEPNLGAWEPLLPQSRLGRRILTKPLRRPDFVRASILQETNRSTPLPPETSAFECGTCGSLLGFSTFAVVVRCPSCGNVQPAASYPNRSQRDYDDR